MLSSATPVGSCLLWGSASPLPVEKWPFQTAAKLEAKTLQEHQGTGLASFQSGLAD